MSLRYDDSQRTPIVVEEVHSSTSPSDHDQILPPRRTKRSSKSHHHSIRYDVDSSRRLLLREDRDDGKKLSTLLLFTSERLELETQRADNAERRATAYVTRLRAAMEAKERADQDLARISEELRLYKLQLDAAQKEIFKAQDVLQMVEKQKYDAELDAAKARTKARDLLEEKTIIIAKEEGRKLGYKDGLRLGRTMGYEEGRSAGFENYGRRARETYENDEEPQDESQDQDYDERAPIPTRVLTPERSRPPSAKSQRDRSLSDPRISSRTPPLPIPTIISSMPPPPPGQLQTSAPVPVPSPSHRPEHIHPKPYRGSARSPSHQSVEIPPDGWIPTADGNSFIALPPPHELAIPVDANPTPRTNTRSLDENDTAERRSMHRPSSRQQHPQVRSRDYAYTNASAPRPGVPPSRPRTNSGASRGSTRISQYDLVSPPQNERSERLERGRDGGDARGRQREREEGRDRSRTPRLSSRGMQIQPDTERIAEEWRSANPNVATPHTSTENDRPSSQQRQRHQRVRGGVEVTSPFTVAQRVADLIRPPLATHVQRPQSPVIDWLFGKRFNNRANSSPPPISIQPPSKSPSENSQATLVHPNLLSPDDAANRPLPDESAPQQDYLSEPHIPLRGPPVVVNNVAIPSVYLPKKEPPTEPEPPSLPEADPIRVSPRPGPSYALAPIPPGVTYPDPPIRPATAAGFSRPSSRAEGNGGQDMRRRGQSFGAMSPAPLHRPISIFSD